MSHNGMTPEGLAQYSAHLEQQRKAKREKHERKLALGLAEPTRREVFIAIVARLKQRGLTPQEIYETLHCFGRAFSSDSMSWPEMEHIIGEHEIHQPDFKLLFKK